MAPKPPGGSLLQTLSQPPQKLVPLGTVFGAGPGLLLSSCSSFCPSHAHHPRPWAQVPSYLCLAGPAGPSLASVLPRLRSLPGFPPRCLLHRDVLGFIALSNYNGLSPHPSPTRTVILGAGSSYSLLLEHPPDLVGTHPAAGLLSHGSCVLPGGPPGQEQKRALDRSLVPRAGVAGEPQEHSQLGCPSITEGVTGVQE